MTTTTLGAGNVDIELDGETVTLRPTLRAAQTISRQAGGISAAADRVMAFDLDVMSSVIALGLNLSGAKATAITEKVYNSGMPELVAPVVRYLTILANGGRPPKDEVDASEENPPA